MVPMSERKKIQRCPKCRAKGERDFGSEGRGFKAHPGNWPMKSAAAGVNPMQRDEAIAESVKEGVPTHFDKEGNAIFTSPEHRKKYCETFGIYDRNGGYSDPRRGEARKRLANRD